MQTKSGERHQTSNQPLLSVCRSRKSLRRGARTQERESIQCGLFPFIQSLVSVIVGVPENNNENSLSPTNPSVTESCSVALTQISPKMVNYGKRHRASNPSMAIKDGSPEAECHDSIMEIVPDVFIARTTVPFHPSLQITRTMAIIRHEDELTLVNPVRLTARLEEDLKRLGRIRCLLRLGIFHGRDDAYYKKKFGAELWAPRLAHEYIYQEPPIDKTLMEDGDALPFPDTKLRLIGGEGATGGSEASLRIDRDGVRVVLSCDGLPHAGDDQPAFFRFRGIALAPQ